MAFFRAEKRFSGESGVNQTLLKGDCMRILLVISLLLTSNLAAAEISSNRENCKKIDGWTSSYIESVEDSVGLPESSLNYLGARIEESYFCMTMFNTPKGVYVVVQ
jgi:hypothetical protein